MQSELSCPRWRDRVVKKSKAKKKSKADDLEGETSEIFSHGSGELIKATQDVLGFRHARLSGFH